MLPLCCCFIYAFIIIIRTFGCGSAPVAHTDNLLLLLLPKNVTTPVQVVVFVPGSNSLSLPSMEEFAGRFLTNLDYLLKSGRAIVLPTLWGTFERQAGLQTIVRF